jgi:hypothetical protein
MVQQEKGAVAMEAEAPAKPAMITVKEFLESVPPGQQRLVSDMGKKERGMHGINLRFRFPELQLHCESNECAGLRFFVSADVYGLDVDETKSNFVTYACKNCGRTRKTYALWNTLSGDEVSGKMYKLGEFPQFGPPNPPRLISIMEMEKEYYLKGRRSENQGMGIAAFAYYRRVVENKKHKIFEELQRVCTKVGAGKDVLQDLEAGKNERQFSKSVEAIKHGLPGALLINGHNPLTLLHNALSEGLHAQTDQECLELARSIRIVLSELVERMGSALKEQAELTQALGRLLQVKAAAKPPAGARE